MRATQSCLVVGISVIFLVNGCANMSNKEERVLLGAGVGAASGAAMTAIAGGHAAVGALGGAALGAGVGYLVDKSKQHQQNSQ